MTCTWYWVETIIGATMFFTSQSIYHFIYKVVDVEEFHLHTAVVDLDGEVVGYVVAESGYGTVIVGTAPLAKKIGEAIYKHLGSGLSAIFKHQFFSGFLAFAIFAGTETADKGGLNGTGNHHRASIAVLLKGVKE